MLDVDQNNNKGSDEIQCCHHRNNFFGEGCDTGDTSDENECGENGYNHTHHPFRYGKCGVERITDGVRLYHISHKAKCQNNGYGKEACQCFSKRSLECVGNVVNRSSDNFSVLIAAFGDLREIRLAVDRCHAEERSKPHPEDGSRAAGYECGRTSCDVSGSDLCGDRCCKCLEGSHAVFSGLLTL